MKMIEVSEDALDSIKKMAEQDTKDAALYRELLYLVGKKYNGESRHETAKRYIMMAETQAIEGERAAAMQTK